MNFTKTSSQILDFINAEIPFNELKKNAGIFETNVITRRGDDNITIGISYEDEEDEKDVYIYNIFIDEEYVNLYNRGNKENKTPISLINEIRDEIRNILLEI